MEGKEKEAYPGRTGQRSSKVVHERCLKRIEKAVQKSVLYPETIVTAIPEILHCRFICEVHVGCYEESWLVGVYIMVYVCVVR